ncbi:ATP-binding protein [Streptomyces sp. NPDC006733]|uniref:ATP-binding protein n=1 Tax=Streptomyces sp. NPDC006733 TaxID=3155460 RepID=UPI003403A1AE
MAQDPAGTDGAPVALAVLYRAAQYGAERSAAGEARELAETFVKELAGLLSVPLRDRFVYDVALVVTELLTNASTFAPGPCLLELEGRPAGVTVAVSDTSTALPRAYPHDPTRIGRHGLEIIHRICADVRIERVPVGKRISATLRLPTIL